MNKALLYIDREGRWFSQGEEITHRRTYLLYCRNLTRDPCGRIILKVGSEECPVEVEDAPFVVRSLRPQMDPAGELESIHLILNDESGEPLNPATLRIHSDHAPYCRVREGLFEARFSRQAYQLLSPFIRQDGDGNRFFIAIGGRRYNLFPRAENAEN